MQEKLKNPVKVGKNIQKCGKKLKNPKKDGKNPKMWEKVKKSCKSWRKFKIVGK